MRKRNALVVALLALALLIVLLFPAGAASSKDQVFEELQRQGLNTAAACGVMANIDKESTFNPSVSSRDGSYGLCQWTGSRKSNLFSYCDQNGLDSSSVEGQIAFLSGSGPESHAQMTDFDHSIYYYLNGCEIVPDTHYVPE